jgi:class 3 adenylate cyclase/tetratricopeptide (TPR) repeat protein
VVVCPNCGEQNPERAKFCLHCGFRLVPEAEAAPTVEERKVVSVVFCELLTPAAAGSLDPEDRRALIEPWQALAAFEIERYGGTVGKFIGEVVMGVFGVPAAHEDDPERAVRAALAIRDGLPRVFEDGSDLDVRIGVNTGDAIVTLGASGPTIGEEVAGDAVNTASRLQTAAAAGTIAVGETTHEATRREFVYEELPPATVKGKSGPLRIFRPLSAHARPGVEVHDSTGTPFVGRDEEMGLLRAAYRRAVREPSVQLVTVAGEPGVGKTRLLDEFRSWIDARTELVRWRQGRCLPYGDGVSFWPLGEMVKGEAGILDSDPPATAAEKLDVALRPLVADPGERDWLRARLAPLAGLGDPTADVPQSELFTAWRRYLEAMALAHPLVLVFEDLHWADPSMLEFVEQLVENVAALPLLVVCSGRLELYDRRPEWGGGKRNAMTIELAPLTQQETATLISSLLGRAVLPAETQAALLERAGGNPLYAEEFVRMLVDRGFLDPARGRRLTLAPDAAVPVPPTVQGIIASRLDALPPDLKALLHDASVTGKVFWAGTLAAVGGRSEPEVRTLLRDLVRRELVRPSRTSTVKDQAEFAFWHLLIRDVAYGQIPRAARGDKHRAVARWLSEVAGDRVSDLAELLAHHWSVALDLARSGARLPASEIAQIEHEAVGALILAGDRVRSLDAMKAEGYYHRALQLLPEGSERHPELLVRAAEVHWVLGRIEDAQRDFEGAIAGYRAAGNLMGMGEAMALMARSWSRRGESTKVRRMLEEAVQVLESQPPGRELARATIRMAGQLMLAGEYRDCLAWCERGLSLARELGMDDEVVLALQARGVARSELQEPGGLDDLREALRLGLELGLGEETAVSYNNLADQLWIREGPASALPAWNEMLEFCRVRGFVTEQMWAKAGILQSLFDTGEWDRALDMAAEVAEWDVERGTKIGAFARIFQAWIRFRRGEVGEAESVVRDLLPAAERIEYAEFLAPVLMIASEVERVHERAERAAALVRTFAEVTEGQTTYRAIFLPVAVRILVWAGDLDAAASLLHDADGSEPGRLGASVTTARAVLDEALGRFEAAEAGYAEAARRWEAYRFVLERGATLLGRGRCLLALGRRREGIEDLRRAEELIAPLGARLLLDEIAAAQATASGSTPAEAEAIGG